MAQLMETFEFLERPEVAVLHGDVKPDNIILTEDDEAKHRGGRGAMAQKGKR